MPEDHSRWSTISRMDKQLVEAAFKVGDEVRVKKGKTVPDLSDIPMGGWSGAVTEVYPNEQPNIYGIKWDQRTLDQMPTVYQNRCERDGYDWETVWLTEDDLEPNTGDAVPIEQPTNLITRPLSMKNQDDRVRAIFCLTSDDLLPTPDSKSLVKYYHYLVEHLSLPLEARYRPESGPFAGEDFRVSVIGLYDIDDYGVDEDYGLIGVGGYKGRRIDFPLADITVTGRSENRQLIDDYSYWFTNY